MFNIFKGQNNNPNEIVLGDLTVNQKMSATNLLYLIARSDGEFNKKELDYLNTCDLGCTLEKCTAYLNVYGHDDMFNDLDQLNSSQKDYLLITAFELMNCDGKINETEMSVFVGAFDKLGYTEDHIVEKLNKMMLFKKNFF